MELFRRDRTLSAMFIMTMNENGSGAGVARDVGNKIDAVPRSMAAPFLEVSAKSMY